MASCDWLLSVLLVVEALGLVAALASPAGHDKQCTGAGCFTVATELSKCKSPEVVSLVKSYNRFSSQLQGREHSPFKISLHKSSSTSVDLSATSCELQVEVSANNPTAHVIGFVLQVFELNSLATSKFVHEAPAGTQDEGKQKITSCSHVNDTIIRLVSTLEKTITVTLFSTNVTAATFLRYFLVNRNNHQVYTDTMRVSLPTAVASYESKENFKNHLRKKREPDDPSAQLLIANGDYLHLSSLDGSFVQTIVLVNHSDDNILAVDYNYRQRYVYWTDSTGGRIMRSNMDGSMVVPVLEEGLNEPDGIAMDWVTNKVYFTDTGLEIVGVFDVENNWYKVLLSTLVGTPVSQPRAIVVDPTTGWMYWTDWGNNARIEKASMDGSNRTVLHSTGLTWPNGLTIDYDAQVLYWVDAFVDVLQSSYVNGSNRITIAGRSMGLAHPFGVSFFNNELFSSDWNGNKVQSITAAGDSVRLVFDDTCTIPYGVVVVSEQRQTELTNPCSSSSCSHLCLLSASDPRGYTCDCPEGFTMTTDQQNCNQQPGATDYSPSPQGSCIAAGHSTCCISGDCAGNPTTCYCDANCHLFGDCCSDVSPECVNTEPNPYLVYTSRYFIHRISARSAGDTDVRLRTILSGLSNAADIDFHYSNGHLYWTDTNTGKIWRSNFSGTGTLMILDVGTSQPTDVAVDWVTNKLYWVNGTDSTINVFDLSTGNQGTLLSVEGTITDLALDPLSSEMYWSVSGSTPMIEKASMNGQSRTTFQSNNMGLPSSLFIDFSQSVVYWADTQQNMVERSNLDGTARTVVYSSSELPTAPGLSMPLSPLSFVIHENALYYVGQFVGVATANGSSSRSVLNYDVGCTQGGGIQLISSSRQPQASNPCATSNGGCASSEICVLSSIGGMACISTDVALPPPPSPGTCAAAGLTGCCESTTDSGSCVGNPPTCSCASNCMLFQDCCSDAVTDCEGPTNRVMTEPPPSLMFTLTPASLSVPEFQQQAVFQCEINIQTASITWYFTQRGSNEPVLLSGQSANYSVQNGDGFSQLTVLRVEFPQDQGEYRCDAANNGESISAAAQLNVLVSPTIIITGPASSSELDNIIIRCVIRANPRPEITWLKSTSNEATRVLDGSRISLESADTPQSTIVSTLQITRVTGDDSGVYVCQVDNGVSPSPVREEWAVNVTIVDDCISSPCENGGTCNDLEDGYTCVCLDTHQGVNCEEEVTVQVAPTITQHPVNVTLDLASPINLTCVATGTPTPSYSWYKDGELVGGETRPYLYIPEAQPENRGKFTCKARNVAGEVNSETALINIPGVLQYSTQVEILTDSPENLREVTLSLVSSELSTTNTIVFSVNISNATQTGELFEVTLLITLLPSQEEPTPEQIVRIRKALISELQQAPNIIVNAENIVRFDGCNSEEYKGVVWPETSLGSTANGPCPCLDIVGESAGRGNRFCGGTFSQGAVWSSDVDLSNCFTSMSAVSQQLCDIALLLGDSPNVTAQVSREIVKITSQSQNLTSNDISTASTVVVHLGVEAATNPEVRENYLQTIDNIIQADEDEISNSQTAANSSVRILDSLGTFLDNVDLATINQNYANNQTTLNLTNFALRIQEIDIDNFGGQTLIIDLGSAEQARNISGGIDPDALVTVNDVSISARRRRLTEEDIKDSTAFLQLSPTFFDDCVKSEISNLSSATSQRLSYSVFVRDALFLPKNRTLNAIGSIIVAARVRCELANKTMLSMPVRSSFQVSTPERAKNSSCARYDERFGAWDPSGCYEVKKLDGRIECECTQLGHFGILFDLDPSPLPEEFAIALSAITYIGLALSLICLAVLVFTDLINKKLRSNIHNQVLVNMSISLMGLYIMFLIGGFTTRVPPLCGIVSALLHYFFLVFFCWTAVESIWLYLKLVTVLGSQSFSSNYMLKAGLPAWLIPAVIVIISGGAGHAYYTSPFYCRPTEWPFYFGYLLPFLVVYVFDWIMFSFIMASICKHARNMNALKEKSKTESIQNLKKNFVIALSLAVVLGLGWGFGLAATSSDIKELTFALQVVFSIFVGSQGVLIFILHGARNADFREFWMKLLRIRKSRRSKFTVTSSQTDRSNKTVRSSGSGSGPVSVALKSVPEKIDLSKKSTSEAFMSEGSSAVQSPTDSVFAPESEMYSELLPGAEPHLDMKPNECYQTIIRTSNSTRGTTVNPPPQYEEVMPVSAT